LLAGDLPFSQGILDAVEVRCPSGSLVDSVPPAPVGAAHLDGALAATSAAMHCLLLALGASPDSRAHALLTAPDTVGWAMMTWVFDGRGGGSETFIHTDGTFGGSAAGHDRDGLDLSLRLVGTQPWMEYPDVEILESNYPLIILERGTGSGEHGAGRFRSGGACFEQLRPHRTTRLVGHMLSTRGVVPNPGVAGGFPGATSSLHLIRADGHREEIGMQESPVDVTAEERFEFRGPTGGGFGDPLDRPPTEVEADVRAHRYDVHDAAAVYGVVLDADGGVDADVTALERARIAGARLEKAQAPRRPRHETAPAVDVPAEAAAPAEAPRPLYPGVVARGPWAVSERSAAVLARAPDHWTDGCPVLEERRRASGGFDLIVRSYLDPVSGNTLAVEFSAGVEERTFEVSPRWWTEAGGARPSP
jgi:N-methylhydantoinase B